MRLVGWLITTDFQGNKERKSMCQVQVNQWHRIKKSLRLNHFSAPLAQLVEQLTLNKRAAKV